jgi:hypothetical protein
MRNVVFGIVVGMILGATGVLVGQNPSPPDAVAADPAHYSVSFENDLVRVLRVSYGPGERSVMHKHLASCVVFLTDQSFNFTLPDGTTEPASVPAGALGCGDGNVHLPENIAERAEFIMMEFKNRERFQR